MLKSEMPRCLRLHRMAEVLVSVQDGQILVTDPASYQWNEKLWALSIILSEASKRAGAEGPFWIMGL